MATMLHPLGAMRAAPGQPGAARRLCLLPRRAMKPLGSKHAIAGSPLLGRRPALGARSVMQHAVCSASQLENPFKFEKPMDGLQSTLSGLPTPAVYALGGLLVAALGGGAGLATNTALPASMRPVGQYAGGVAGAALGALLTKKLLEKRQSAAIIELSNLLVQMGDPTQLTREQVTAIEAKYGVNLAANAVEGVKLIYGTFVEALLPPGDVALRGTEHVLIQNFKAALGLPDVDAAPVHIDVGRRILRGRLEAGSRGEDFEARKAFQKLIYVSNLVFGDRQAAFLLPWARVFGLNDAQVYVAKRDNARQLFKAYIDGSGGELQAADLPYLTALKQAQEQVRLADDEAEGVVREAARARIEGCLDRAVECVKRRTRVRDYSDAMRELRTAIDFNRSLAAARGNPDVVRGAGVATIAGGKFEGEGKEKDLREVLRVFVEESMGREGAYSDALEADVSDLRTMMQLGTKESAAIEAEIKEKVYRRLLRDEFTSGRLEAAPSKAEVLAGLVERVRMDPEAAKELHRSLYRQKLSTILEKKKITEEDDEELARLQRMLCIPADERAALHNELCGGIFKDAVNKALSGGVDSFGFEDRAAVKQAAEDLRMDSPAARKILDDVARKYFMQFITTSRNQRNKLDSAKELKKLVFFSNICVTPLLEDLKTEEEKKAEIEAAEQQKQLMEMIKKAQEEAAKKQQEEKEGAEAAEPAEAKAAEGAEGAEAKPAEAAAAAAEAAAEEQPASLQKAQAAAAARAEGESASEGGASSGTMKAQKDITLRADLELRDRVDTYRNFLLYCMSGDVVQGPMGVTMVTERNEGEFARLSQLGDILGLSQMDVANVHQGLAEQAFKQQVQSYMADGQMTPDRAAALESLREKMGLPKEAADKIVKGFTNQRLIAGLQAAKAQGQLTLERVLELKEGGVDVSSLLNDDARANLYRQEVMDRLSDGSGNFDAERLLQRLPSELELDAKKAGRVVEELAGSRKRDTLVQAISNLRQRKVKESVKSVNNLLACEAALPTGGPAKWEPREEVQDLYSVYCSKETDGGKRSSVAAVLGLSEEEGGRLAEIVDAGQFKLGGDEAEDDDSFF